MVFTTRLVALAVGFAAADGLSFLDAAQTVNSKLVELQSTFAGPQGARTAALQAVLPSFNVAALADTSALEGTELDVTAQEVVKNLNQLQIAMAKIPTDECTKPCAAVYDAAQQIVRNVQSRMDAIAFAAARAAEEERSSSAASTGVFILTGAQYNYVENKDPSARWLGIHPEPDFYVNFLSPRGWLQTRRIDDSYTGSFALSESWGCVPFDSPPQVAYELVDFDLLNSDDRVLDGQFTASPSATAWVRPGRPDRSITFSWRWDLCPSGCSGGRCNPEPSCATCPAGQYKAGCLDTATPICRPCQYSVCPPGSYRSGSCGEPGSTETQFTCTPCPVTECAEDELEVGLCTGPGTDQQPRCSRCKSGDCDPATEFENPVCDAVTGTFGCVSCGESSCPYGFYLAGSCGSDVAAEDRQQCKPCGNSRCSYDAQYPEPESCTSETKEFACKQCVNAVCPKDAPVRQGSCSADGTGFTCVAYKDQVCGTDEVLRGDPLKCDACKNALCPPGKVRTGVCIGPFNYDCDDPTTSTTSSIASTTSSVASTTSSEDLTSTSRARVESTASNVDNGDGTTASSATSTTSTIGTTTTAVVVLGANATSTVPETVAAVLGALALVVIFAFWYKRKQRRDEISAAAKDALRSNPAFENELYEVCEMSSPSNGAATINVKRSGTDVLYAIPMEDAGANKDGYLSIVQSARAGADASAANAGYVQPEDAVLPVGYTQPQQAASLDAHAYAQPQNAALSLGADGYGVVLGSTQPQNAAASLGADGYGVVLGSTQPQNATASRVVADYAHLNPLLSHSGPDGSALAPGYKSLDRGKPKNRATQPQSRGTPGAIVYNAAPSSSEGSYSEAQPVGKVDYAIVKRGKSNADKTMATIESDYGVYEHDGLRKLSSNDLYTVPVPSHEDATQLDPRSDAAHTEA